MAKPKKFEGQVGEERSLRHPKVVTERDECGIVPSNETVSEEEYREYMKARMTERVKKARIPLTKI